MDDLAYRTATSKSAADLMTDEQADLWAMSYGFADAREMKEWGERVERERLAESASRKGT